MTDMNPSEFYKTNSMALATYLRMQGHTVQHVEWEDGVCHWFFRITDGLLDLADKFLNDEAMVNPRAYNYEYKRTKQELYRTKA